MPIFSSLARRFMDRPIATLISLGVLWFLVVPFVIGMVNGLLGPYLLFMKIALAATIATLLAGVAYKLEWTGKKPLSQIINLLPEKIKENLLSGLSRFTNATAFRTALQARQQAEYIDFEVLSNALKSKVIGQDEVIDEFTMTIRNRLAKEVRDRPVGVFLFVGPSGVGKTLLAKQAAKAMKRPFHFENMTQATNESAIQKLFGIPEGYVGSGKFGSITATLRDKKNAIILLDEVEKATNEVRQAFLVPFDQGFATDQSAPTLHIDATQAIFIMTSNAGQDRIAELAKQNLSAEEYRIAATNILREENFSPELLGRVDEIFVFRPVVGEEAAMVAGGHIEELIEEYGLKLAEGGIDFQILLDAMDKAEILQKAGGLRAVRRMIEKNIAADLIDAKRRGAKVVSLSIEPGDGLNKIDVNVEE